MLSPSPNILTKTIFLGVSGLNVLPFTTSYEMNPDYCGDDCSYTNRFTLTAIKNGNNVDITLQVA